MPTRSMEPVQNQKNGKVQVQCILKPKFQESIFTVVFNPTPVGKAFSAFFEAKMTKIVILDQKLIVPNDYLQFWAHFEWFLSLFQISEVKQLLSQFKLKVRKNGTFRSQNQFLKNFPVNLVPQPFLCQKIGSNWSLNRFLQGGLKTPPPLQQLIAQKPYRSRVKFSIPDVPVSVAAGSSVGLFCLS